MFENMVLRLKTDQNETFSSLQALLGDGGGSRRKLTSRCTGR